MLYQFFIHFSRSVYISCFVVDRVVFQIFIVLQLISYLKLAETLLLCFDEYINKYIYRPYDTSALFYLHKCSYW